MNYQPLNQQQRHFLVVHLVYIDKELLMNLDNYLIKLSIKLYIGIVISKFSAVSTCSSLISKLHLVNGAQFFKANLVVASAAAALIVPSTKILASA